MVSDPALDCRAAAARRRWHRPLLGVLSVGGPADGRHGAISEGAGSAELKLREAVVRRSLALADLASGAFAALLCVNVLGSQSLRPAALLVLPLVVIAAKLLGLYDRDELLINKATIDEAPRLFQLATTNTLLFTILQYQFAGSRLHLLQIVGLWAALFVFSVVARGAARSIAIAVSPPERCLFVGSEASAERLRSKLAAADRRAILVGRMSIGEGAASSDAEAAAALLHRVVGELRVHRVIVEPSEPHPQTTLDFVREAKSTGARVSLLPRILEVVGSSIEVDDVDGLTLLGVRRFGLSRSSALIKRTFDLVGAGLGLLAISPLLAVIAAWIKLDSRGPVFYRQVRIGRGGEPFGIWKFRTMVVGADAMKAALRDRNEADGLFKIADDPRITGAGRVLRKYSLDELPQLINVLRGEMSLVGPRPLVADDDARITGLDRRRLHLTPGMTGRWQILGSSRVPLAEMVKLDYLYVTGWSLWTDLKILLRTIPYVLARRGL